MCTNIMRKLLNISMIVVAVCFIGPIHSMEREAKRRKINEFCPIEVSGALKIICLVGSLDQVARPFCRILQEQKMKDYKILIRENFDEVLTELSQEQCARQITNLCICCADSLDLIYFSLRRLSNLYNLHTLSLAGNRFSQSTIKQICFLTTLQKLDLSDNNLSSESVEKIYELKSLRYLNLGENQIEYLPKKITKLSNLEILDLQDNRLNHEELRYICQLTRLRDLKL